MATAIAITTTVAACGDGGEASGTSTAVVPGGGTVLAEVTDATLVLDFIPNAVHAGIYAALAEGCYAERNLNLEIIEPTSTADTLKLIDAGKAEFGIADGSDVAGQIEAGRGAKGIMAIVQRPQGQLITLEESGITDPSQLEGGVIGISGVPSDAAVLQTIARDAGGDPDQIEVVTIGFNGVQALENGVVDAFVGFAADGVQIELDGFPIRAFALDEFGGPAYPGLVVFSTEERISEEPELLSAFVECTVSGYEATIANPESGLSALEEGATAIDSELAEAQLDLYLPQFRSGGGGVGSISDDSIVALSDFLVTNGLAEAALSPDRYATNEFIPSHDAGVGN